MTGAMGVSVRAVLPVALFLAAALGGCLGGEARTEWAFEITGLADVEGRTGRGVVVAVLDTGVNVGHPSLDHLVDGDSANGELTRFRDFIGGKDGVAAAFDDDGHGTHVVGILAARGSRASDKLLYGGVDLRGGSPGIELVVARVCDEETCDAAAIPQAIRWAVEEGRADVLSLSLGGQSALPALFDDALESDLEAAIREAVDQGVVVVAAAGNDGPGNTDVSTPADIPDVIAVGAIGKDGKVADLSSRGDDAGNPCTPLPLQTLGRCDPSKKPELVAPGVDILSSWTGDSYARATGTSQATPFVSAVVALLLEGKPKLRDRADVLEVKEVLMETARPVAGQVEPHDEAAGYGIVQAVAALRAYG